MKSTIALLVIAVLLISCSSDSDGKGNVEKLNKIPSLDSKLPATKKLSKGEQEEALKMMSDMNQAEKNFKSDLIWGGDTPGNDGNGSGLFAHIQEDKLNDLIEQNCTYEVQGPDENDNGNGTVTAKFKLEVVDLHMSGGCPMDLMLEGSGRANVNQSSGRVSGGMDLKAFFEWTGAAHPEVEITRLEMAAKAVLLAAFDTNDGNLKQLSAGLDFAGSITHKDYSQPINVIFYVRVDMANQDPSGMNTFVKFDMAVGADIPGMGWAILRGQGQAGSQKSSDDKFEFTLNGEKVDEDFDFDSGLNAIIAEEAIKQIGSEMVAR